MSKINKNLYARIEDGKVAFKGELPKNTKNVSSLNALSDEELKQFGYFPLIEEKPNYDPGTQKLVEGEYIINQDSVVLSFLVEDFTLEELEAAELEKWEGVRLERGALLSGTDWAILPDSPLSNDAIIEMKAYRQKLRSIPQDFSKADDVIWPDKPEV